jgi:hypothetical protein
MPTFEEKAGEIVRVAAEIARAQNFEPLATVLEKSSASLIESGSDPYNETTNYALTLEIPVRTYAEIEGHRDGLEQTIRERIRPILRKYPGSWISEVIITPEFTPKPTSASVTPEEEQPLEEIPSFWQKGFFRLFITHTSPNKVSAHNLKSSLAKYQVAAFVAHDDIDPTKEWQLEIERALRTMDALAAITTPDFVESSWCDQEVGFALGRGKLVLPLCKEATPHGFLGKYQGFQAKELKASNVAEQLVEILITHPLSAERMADALVERMASSFSYDTSRNTMRLLERVPRLTETQVAKLIQSITDSDQVANSFRVPERIRGLVSRLQPR